MTKSDSKFVNEVLPDLADIDLEPRPPVAVYLAGTKASRSFVSVGWRP